MAQHTIHGLRGLEEKINHQFHNKDLCKKALEHPSVKNTSSVFERLEFLGDRVLGLVMAAYLYRKHPLESEGALARRYGALVGRGSLEKVARSLDLSRHLSFERAPGAASHLQTVLCDSCEALLGALFLDGGFGVAQQTIEGLWAPLFLDQKNPPVDAKSALQEWAQANEGNALPVYTFVEVTGPDHHPQFKVAVSLKTVGPFVGKGPSKRLAQKEAAQKALEHIFQAPFKETYPQP